MKVTRFDPTSELIFVPVFIWGPRGERTKLEMIVDTGAAVTCVAPSVLDGLGYNPRDGEAITSLRSAVAEEPGYLIRIVKLRALGFEVVPCRVHAHDLPSGFETRGLLGLDFLRRFNYEVRSAEGRFIVDRISSRF